ncbi:restriction endonuclease subunit S [Ruegeria pomeroyi]|nr:restriction endonuclease subunit S [Ruegeria pomeroyi]
MKTAQSIPLAENADVIRGVTFSKADSVAEARDGYMPVLRAGNIQDRLILGDGLVFVPKNKVSEKQKLRRGDIVMCTSSGSPEIVGKTAYSYDDWDGSFGAFCAVVRPKKGKIHSRYLFHYLQSPRFRDWTRNSSGVGIKNIRKSELDAIEIPVPSIEEQCRIAAILDKADAIRRKREQALDFADEFLKSVFLEMFGDPVTNPKGYRQIPLGDIIKVSSGNGLTAKMMDPDGSYPVYGGNGINGYHSEYMFEESRIVIGRVGVYCGAVHISEPRSWITDNALYVREYKMPINKTYLEWALRFANLNQYAGRAAQPLISGSRIYPIEIVVPEDEEQNRFERVVQKKLSLTKKLGAAVEASKDFFGSLSQRAFRGEL